MKNKAKKRGKMNTPSKIFKFFVYLAIVFTFAFLIWIILDVLIRGIPHLSPQLFETRYTTNNVSMFPAIINTLEMILITLLIAVPIGIITAIYMVEYADSENTFFKMVNLMVETLQGIPSIIFGLFGMLFFGNLLGWSYTILAGSLTMAIMVLPLIITSTIEALKSVPLSQREASYALGARKVRTIFRVVLPAASKGIFSGVILAIGRAVGETAALMYTAGTGTQIAGVMESGRTLAIHMYMLSTESLHKNETYATAFVLMVIVIIINGISSYMNNKLDTDKEK